MTRNEHLTGVVGTYRTETDEPGPLGSAGGVAVVLAGLVIVAAVTVADGLSIGATTTGCSSAAATDVGIPGGSTSGVLMFIVGGTIAAGVGAPVLAKTVSRRMATHSRHVGDVAATGGDADPAVLSLVAEPYTTVEETHRRLRALERLFRERDDRRAVFLTVYARVTGEVGRAIERGAFDDPDWVADYLVTFANLYRRAVFDFETDRVDSLPMAWRLAFRAAEREGTLVLQHAALGVNAHVTFDLAFALFAVGVSGGRRTKYGDHQRINVVLWQLVDETLDRLAERYAPGIAALENAAGPSIKLAWFGALVVGRECAWWIALVMTESRGEYPTRVGRYLVATASSAIALAVVGPTVHPVTTHAIQSVTQRLGVRRL